MPSPMPARYTSTAIFLHWLIALVLLGQFAFGLFLEDIPRGTPARGYYVNLHKSTGILIGLLILARIAWRLTHTPPPLPPAMPGWQKLAARLSHVVLYLCMLALPLSGYLASNFSKHGVKFFNTVHWQAWGPDDKAVYSLLNQTHKLAALVLAIFVVLHLLAVIKHMVVDRDGLLLRMWPARARPVPPRTAPSPETR
jgi:cytochrome b561